MVLTMDLFVKNRTKDKTLELVRWLAICGSAIQACIKLVYVCLLNFQFFSVIAGQASNQKTTRVQNKNRSSLKVKGSKK